MSILVGKDSRILCQGVGRAGLFHTSQCIAYGTKVVGGVKPGKGGSTAPIDAGDGKEYDPLPLFNTGSEAVAAVRPDVSMIYVPAPGAAAAPRARGARSRAPEARERPGWPGSGAPEPRQTPRDARRGPRPEDADP